MYTWGNNVYGSMNVPEEIQGRVTEIEGGRYHFTAILDDGTAFTWGNDTFNQTDAPSL